MATYKHASRYTLLRDKSCSCYLPCLTVCMMTSVALIGAPYSSRSGLGGAFLCRTAATLSPSCYVNIRLRNVREQRLALPCTTRHVSTRVGLDWMTVDTGKRAWKRCLCRCPERPARSRHGRVGETPWALSSGCWIRVRLKP